MDDKIFVFYKKKGVNPIERERAANQFEASRNQTNWTRSSSGKRGQV
jgi:uncharacterized protein YuzE